MLQDGCKMLLGYPTPSNMVKRIKTGVSCVLGRLCVYYGAWAWVLLPWLYHIILARYPLLWTHCVHRHYVTVNVLKIKHKGQLFPNRHFRQVLTFCSSLWSYQCSSALSWWNRKFKRKTVFADALGGAINRTIDAIIMCLRFLICFATMGCGV